MKGLFTKVLAGLRGNTGVVVCSGSYERRLVLCDHSGDAGARGRMAMAPRERALEPASRQRLRPLVSQREGAREIANVTLPPPSNLLLRVPIG